MTTVHICEMVYGEVQPILQHLGVNIQVAIGTCRVLCSVVLCVQVLRLGVLLPGNAKLRTCMYLNQN